jgi:hypothetical protein
MERFGEQKASIDLVHTRMAAEPACQTLFIGAGLQMHCGVGQFTRLLSEAIARLEPGGCTTLTLTRSEGTLAEIWRATGSARNVVCNFPIVAWKRVIFRPLLALALARLRGRRVVLILHEWARLHPLRRITYIPALLLVDTIVMFSPLVRRELAEDPLVGFTAKKTCWRLCRQTSKPPRGSLIPNCGGGSLPVVTRGGW